MSEESMELLHIIRGFGSLHKKGSNHHLRLGDGTYIRLHHLHGGPLSVETATLFMRDVSALRDTGMLEGVQILEQGLIVKADEELSLAEQKVKRLEAELTAAKEDLQEKKQFLDTLRRLLKDATKPEGLRSCAGRGSKMGGSSCNLQDPPDRSPDRTQARSHRP